MKLSSILSIFICSAAVILAAKSAAAAIFVTTLTKPDNGAAAIVSLNQAAIPFATDASSYALNSISVSIYEDTAGSLVGELFLADGSSFPTGAALASFTHGAIQPGGPNGSAVTFTPTASLTLNPSTAYAFALRSP